MSRPDQCLLLENRILQDPVLIYTPQDSLYNRTLKQGHLLLWDPTAFAGHPYLAIGHPSVLYPPRLVLHRLLDPLVAREALLFLHLYASGLFMYLFLRELALGRTASLVGGMAWMLGGYPVVYLEFEFVTLACAHIPLALLFAERLAARRTLREASFLGLTVGSLVLTGHWQYVAYGLLAVGGYLAWRCGEAWRQTEPALRVAGLAALALALGLGLGAAQLLPSVELLQDSHRPVRTLQELYAGSRFFPENLLTLVIPDALGHPRHQFWFTRMASNVQTYMDLCGYVGTATFVLAVLGALRGPKRRLYFVLLCAAALVYAMGLPGADLFYLLLPGFKSFVPGRVMLLYCLGASVLAAYGTERAARGDLTWRATALGVSLLAALGAFLAVVCLQFQKDPEFLQSVALFYAPGGMFALPNYCEDKAGQVQTVLQAIQSHYAVGQPTLFVPLGLGLAGLAALHFRKHWKTLLLATLAADLLYFGMRFSPPFPVDTAFPADPALAVLAEGDGRAAGVSRGLHPNLQTAYGIRELGGYGSLFPGRYARFLEAVSGHEQTYLMADLWDAERLTPALARFLNLRHLYTDPLHDLPSWAGPLAHDRGLRIARLPDPLPPYFVARRATVEADPEKVLQAMLDPDWDPETAFVEAGPAPKSEARGTARVVEQGPNRVVIEAEADAEALLVGSETWYPGWEARVDGQPAPVLRANYAFQAVPVPAGRHRVELAFRPRSFRIGSAISLMCLALLLVGALRRPTAAPG